MEGLTSTESISTNTGRMGKYGSEGSVHNYSNEKLSALPESYGKLISSLVPNELKTNKGVFVDVGAGTGELAIKMEENGMAAIPLDYSQVGMAERGVKGVVASADSLPLKDNVADIIHSKDMIEHLDSQEFNQFIEESKRVLNENGKLIITEKKYYTGFPFNQKPWVNIENKGKRTEEEIKVNEKSADALERINKKYNDGIKNGEIKIGSPYFPRSREEIIRKIQELGFECEKVIKWEAKKGEPDWFGMKLDRNVMVFKKTNTSS